MRIRLRAVMVVAFVRLGWAQVDTGTILGTVRDQAEAVVPGVKVTLRNEGTGVSTATLTRSIPF